MSFWKTRFAKGAFISAVAACMLAASGASAIPSEFTYQAQLVSSITGNSINSSNVTVTLDFFASSAASIPVATRVYPGQNLLLTGGYVNLDVASAGLNLGGDLFVEVVVDDLLDADPPERLSGRQKITSVPFALNAQTLEGENLLGIRTYAENEGLAAEANAEAFLISSLANFNRVVVVNSAITQSAVPDGSLTDPFDNLAGAYAFAKSLPGAGSFVDRIAVYMMPGRHDVNTTVVLDTVGIDVVGFGSGTSLISGSADPLLRFQAGTSGPKVANIQLRPSGASNRALEALSGGRLIDVEIGRFTGGPGLTLVTINVPKLAAPNSLTLSFNGFAIYGNVDVVSYGDQTTFTGGFITGTVACTSTVGADFNEFLSFSDVASIGGFSMTPAAPGIVLMSNIQGVFSVNYNANTIIRTTNVAFLNPATLAPLALTQPAANSAFINTFANIDASLWSGTILSSTGNVTTPINTYTVFLTKL